jgi:His-Xaa-Ser system protein HxsD
MCRTHRTRLTRRIHPADTDLPPLPEILVEFDRVIQNIGPLREAAYRLIGLASCRLETAENRYVCRLQLNDNQDARRLGEQRLQQRFIDLVTVENLREQVSAETANIRNVILALAFGALVEQDNNGPGT